MSRSLLVIAILIGSAAVGALLLWRQAEPEARSATAAVPGSPAAPPSPERGSVVGFSRTEFVASVGSELVSSPRDPLAWSGHAVDSGAGTRSLVRVRRASDNGKVARAELHVVRSPDLEIDSLLEVLSGEQSLVEAQVEGARVVRADASGAAYLADLDAALGSRLVIARADDAVGYLETEPGETPRAPLTVRLHSAVHAQVMNASSQAMSNLPVRVDLMNAEREVGGTLADESGAVDLTSLVALARERHRAIRGELRLRVHPLQAPSFTPVALPTSGRPLGLPVPDLAEVVVRTSGEAPEGEPLYFQLTEDVEDPPGSHALPSSIDPRAGLLRRANDAGEASFWVAPGTALRVRALIPGLHAPLAVSSIKKGVAPGSGKTGVVIELSLQLPPQPTYDPEAFVVRGRAFLDEGGERSIARHQIVLVSVLGKTTELRARTSFDGAFEVHLPLRPQSIKGRMVFPTQYQLGAGEGLLQVRLLRQAESELIGVASLPATVSGGIHHIDAVFLRPPVALASGRVVDDRGEPLPDVPVFAFRELDEDDVILASTFTRADGSYALSAPELSVRRLRLEADGADVSASKEALWVENGAIDADFRMVRAGVVEVTLVHAEASDELLSHMTRAHLEGAPAWCDNTGQSSIVEEGQVTTRFSIARGDVLSLILGYTYMDGGVVLRKNIQAIPGEEIHLGVIDISDRVGFYRLEVLNSQGEHHDSTRARILRAGGISWGDPKWFRLPGPFVGPAGPLLLEVEAPGYERRTVEELVSDIAKRVGLRPL